MCAADARSVGDSSVLVILKIKAVIADCQTVAVGIKKMPNKMCVHGSRHVMRPSWQSEDNKAIGQLCGSLSSTSVIG